MPAQKKTTLGLNQWIGSEYPKRVDFVEDNKIINDELENRVKYTDLAEENKAGIITYAKIKEIAPKPDLSPYQVKTNFWKYPDPRLKMVGTNDIAHSYTGMEIEMFNSFGQYQGSFHTNSGRAYYKVPGRAGGGWCEIMDHIDMATRDNRMNNIEHDKSNLWSKANDAWNRTQDLYNRTQDLYNRSDNDTVRDVRLVGHIAPIVAHANQATERGGYVVTGLVNGNNDHVIDQVQMRAFQVKRGGAGGQNWYNVPFG